MYNSGDFMWKLIKSGIMLISFPLFGHSQALGSQFADGTVFRIDQTGKHGAVFKIIADSATYDQALHACDSMKGWKLSVAADWIGQEGSTGIEEVKEKFKIHFPGQYYWINGSESSMSATAMIAAGNYSTTSFYKNKSRLGVLVVHKF